MLRRLTLILTLVGMVGLLTAPAVAAARPAQPADTDLNAIPVTGTLSDGGSFDGLLNITDLSMVDGVLTATGTLFITDLVFSNPAAESGPLQLRRNDDELLVLRLENFRDLDFHFVTPIVFGPGDRLRLTCDDCEQAAVYYSGFER